ncbi:microtubule-binding protein TANGLED-like [Hibiscus syriacus]|uniref:Microtubule-binding protein TANGLED-like n=1 Tax=Hibiscus syriacus TaxID=106335 RepID=A0A6A2YXD2_HIBSY|nr:microtubule-binding protein TANGLED-like [Hibiscus syriacus]
MVVVRPKIDGDFRQNGGWIRTHDVEAKRPIPFWTKRPPSTVVDVVNDGVCGRTGEHPPPPVLSSSSASAVLGSAAELKAAFRTKILSNYSRSEIIRGCPYSCVKRAPHAFTYDPLTGTERATSQGHSKDSQVQLAVDQCPRSCIHFVTPSQRIILEELLDRYVCISDSLQQFSLSATFNELSSLPAMIFRNAIEL